MKRMTKKAIAVLLSALMICAYMPGLAFAETESVDVDALRQAVSDAKVQMDLAENAMNDAQEAEAEAKSTLDEKNGAAKEADGKATAAEKNAASLESTRDEAFQAAKDAAEQEYEDAKAALSAAEKALKDAQADYSTKSTALETALADKASLQSEIETLTSEKAQLQEQVDSLPAEIEAAQTTLNQAQAQWEQDQADAAAALESAQAAYDAAGYTFINNKIDALGSEFFNLDEMTEICKSYSDATFSSPVTFNGKTISSLADAAKDASFKEFLQSNCSKENLLLSMDMIDRSNEIREAEGKSTMEVSYQLMGVAMMSNTFTLYSRGHILFDKNGKDSEGYANTDSFWAIGPAKTGNENLYYCTGKIMNANQPYIGWYDEEKAEFQKVVDSGQFPGLTMQTSTREVWAKYTSDISDAGFGIIGHYLTLKNEEYTTTGAAVTYNSGTVPTSWRGRATQSFNDDEQNSITVSQCRNEINAAFAEVEEALTEAQARKEALKVKPESVTSAETALKEKQDQLAAAKAGVAEKQGQITEKNSELEDLKTEIEKKTAAKETAADLVTEKETAKGEAETLCQEKEAANTKAQALDTSDSSTYKDYPDLVTAAENARVARSDAEDARTDADNAKTNAETAKTAYDAKHSDYLTKKTAYETACEVYQDAVDTLTEATDVKNAKISVSAQTYSGKRLMPAPKVVLNGKTLVKDEDYTVRYANNVNAGTASVTIIGNGLYCGETVVKFTIKKASNTMMAKGLKVTVKYKKLKKKAQTVKRAKAISLSKKKGTVTYQKFSGNKKITINKKSGQITLKKGLKKGTYIVKINVTDSGTKNYNKLTKPVTVTIKVK